MSKIKRVAASALERGQFIRTCQQPESLAQHPENRARVADLYQCYRFERVMELQINPFTRQCAPSKPTTEWVVVGRRGRAYEQGPYRLGITLTGSRRIAPLVRQLQSQTNPWLKVEQLGEDEANFSCDWTEDNVEKLDQMVGLIRRRGRKATATASGTATPLFPKAILK